MTKSWATAKNIWRVGPNSHSQRFRQAVVNWPYYNQHLTLEKAAIPFFLLVCFSKVCGPFKILEWGYFAWCNGWLQVLWPTRVLFVFCPYQRGSRKKAVCLPSFWMVLSKQGHLTVAACRFLIGNFIKSQEKPIYKNSQPFPSLELANISENKNLKVHFVPLLPPAPARVAVAGVYIYSGFLLSCIGKAKALQCPVHVPSHSLHKNASWVTGFGAIERLFLTLIHGSAP